MFLQIVQEAQMEIRGNAHTLENIIDHQPRPNFQARFNVIDAIGMGRFLSNEQLLRIIIPRPLLDQICRILKHLLEIDKHPQTMPQ